FLYARQNLVGKLPVGAHTMGFLSHAHVALINQGLGIFLYLEILIRPGKVSFRSPHLASKIIGFRVLDGFERKRRNPVKCPAIGSYYVYFVALAMRNGNF